MSTHTPNPKEGGKKSSMDPEVTRVVLIFLLLLVIIALLVAAFMSLGNGTSTADGNVIPIAITTDENGDVIPATEYTTTVDPNHNAPTETIPEEILNPSSENETGASDLPGEETLEPVQTLVTPEGEQAGDATRMTTTGERPANTNPVYISTTGLATLAPPLTTAGEVGDGSPTTITTTVNVSQASDGAITSVNYTVSLTGSAGIYSEPNGSSNGTIGSNGTFTIIQEQTDSNGVKWGKLKSGAGWVRLN
ncbi:MAG: hypothetical protein K2J25_06785 [Oscillospiraceae bacterium]|nr:hypothetical protein [Oscillospiraceae bacterium]